MHWINRNAIWMHHISCRVMDFSNPLIRKNCPNNANKIFSFKYLFFFFYHPFPRRAYSLSAIIIQKATTAPLLAPLIPAGFMVIVRPSYRIWRVNIIVVLNYKPFWLKRERERGMVLALSRFYGEEKSNVNWWLLSCLSWDDKGLYNLPLDQILGWPITREGLKECGNSISLFLYKRRKHSIPQK